MLLIFVFVAREALPVFLGETSTALVQLVIPPEQLDKMSPAEVQTYLALTPKQFAGMDKETLRTLMDVKVEAANEIPAQFRDDPDAKANTTEWNLMLKPHQWQGYAKPEYIWQPVGEIKKFNLIPLFIGTLKGPLTQRPKPRRHFRRRPSQPILRLNIWASVTSSGRASQDCWSRVEF